MSFALATTSPLNDAPPTWGQRAPSRPATRARSPAAAPRWKRAWPWRASSWPCACSQPADDLSSMWNGQGSPACCKALQAAALDPEQVGLQALVLAAQRQTQRIVRPGAAAQLVQFERAARRRALVVKMKHEPVQLDRPDIDRRARRCRCLRPRRSSSCRVHRRPVRAAARHRGPRYRAAAAGRAAASKGSTRTVASPTAANSAALNPGGFEMRRSPMRSRSGRPSDSCNAPCTTTGRPRTADARCAAASRQRERSRLRPAANAATSATSARQARVASATATRRQGLTGLPFARRAAG